MSTQFVLTIFNQSTFHKTQTDQPSWIHVDIISPDDDGVAQVLDFDANQIVIASVSVDLGYTLRFPLLQNKYTQIIKRLSEIRQNIFYWFPKTWSLTTPAIIPLQNWKFHIPKAVLERFERQKASELVRKALQTLLQAFKRSEKTWNPFFFRSEIG